MLRKHLILILQFDNTINPSTFLFFLLCFLVGYPLGFYAKSIPRTVRHLSLMGVRADLKAVRIMAEQVPDLLHLHLDLCCHDICNIIKEIPQMFPKLQVLKVR